MAAVINPSRHSLITPDPTTLRQRFDTYSSTPARGCNALPRSADRRYGAIAPLAIAVRLKALATLIAHRAILGPAVSGIRRQEAVEGDLAQQCGIRLAYVQFRSVFERGTRCRCFCGFGFGAPSGTMTVNALISLCARFLLIRVAETGELSTVCTSTPGAFRSHRMRILLRTYNNKLQPARFQHSNIPA